MPSDQKVKSLGTLENSLYTTKFIYYLLLSYSNIKVGKVVSKNLFQRIVEFAGITALSFSLLACPRKEQKSSPDEKQSVVQVSTEQISSYKQEYGMKEEGKSKQEEKELAGKGLLEDLTNQLVEEQNEALAKTIETNKADNPPGRIYFSGKKRRKF